MHIQQNTSICIKDIKEKYFSDLLDLACENYMQEQRNTLSLPSKLDKAFIKNGLERLLSTGIGKIAFEGDKLVGFLAFDKIYEMNENGAKGASSPIYGYGIKHEKRGKVISMLFQRVAADLCENHVQSIRVSAYAHDIEVLSTYWMSAFSMDTTEVVRNVNDPLKTVIFPQYRFREVEKTELMNYKNDVITLYRSLINHLQMSPVFYNCTPFLPIEERFNDFLGDNIRIFAVFNNNELIGMVNSEAVDIPLVSSDSLAQCMGDLFIKPAYRGQGIAEALLKYANDKLKETGYERLYVTHGTINPNARGFWDKYFTNFTYTMTREIDPTMLGVIKSV